MSKKFAKLLLVSAAIGSAVGAAYYFIRKKNAELESAEEDYDDFSDEEPKSNDSRSYVPLNPETKTENEESACKEPACHEEAPGETPVPEEESTSQGAFTPLADQVAQTAEAAEETVEEFFDEDSTDEEPTISEN